jgi:hypothetical protein
MSDATRERNQFILGRFEIVEVSNCKNTKLNAFSNKLKMCVLRTL